MAAKTPYFFERLPEDTDYVAAFNQGWDAAEFGVPKHRNPYTRDSGFFEMWFNGWNEFHDGSGRREVEREFTIFTESD